MTFFWSFYRFLTTERKVKDIEKTLIKIEEQYKTIETALHKENTNRQLADLNSYNLTEDIKEIKTLLEKSVNYQTVQAERITILETNLKNMETNCSSRHKDN